MCPHGTRVNNAHNGPHTHTYLGLDGSYVAATFVSGPRNSLQVHPKGKLEQNLETLPDLLTSDKTFEELELFHISMTGTAVVSMLSLPVG